MSTTIRSELSKKNPYWIERHRYYELKHFCMQYPFWKKMLGAINGMPKQVEISSNKQLDFIDPTGEAVLAREYYSNRMKMLEGVAKETDPIIGMDILRGVTTGMSYDTLKIKMDIPCCKDVYYDLYRKFFWLLDRERR